MPELTKHFEQCQAELLGTMAELGYFVKSDDRILLAGIDPKLTRSWVATKDEVRLFMSLFEPGDVQCHIMRQGRPGENPFPRKADIISAVERLTAPV